MPSGGDLKSGDSLFFFTTPTPSNFNAPSPPRLPPLNKLTQPQWELVRTLYEVLHEGLSSAISPWVQLLGTRGQTFVVLLRLKSSYYFTGSTRLVVIENNYLFFFLFRYSLP